MVQLQSGEPSALVLPGVDLEGAGTAGPVPSFHHGGQPRPVAPDPGPLPQRLLRRFYRRFVLGEWTAAQGRVYDFFDRDRDSVPVPEGDFQEWRISVDYGTANPASFGLWGRQGEIWYRVGEFYYDSRREGRQKTDAEYVRDLRELAEGREITRVIVDPSAASFIEALRREGFPVGGPADNDVADGIRVTADLLKRRRIVICGACADCLREMETYCWDDRGRDAPKKEQDHAMDDLRYFCHGSGGGRAEWLCGHLGGETGLRDRGKEWTGGLEVEVVSESRRRRRERRSSCGRRDTTLWTAGAVCAHAQWGDPAVPGSAGGGAGGGRRHLQADPHGGRCDGRLFRPGGRAGAGEFLRTVPAGRGQYGVNAFLEGYLDALLTCGRGHRGDRARSRKPGDCGRAVGPGGGH